MRAGDAFERAVGIGSVTIDDDAGLTLDDGSETGMPLLPISLDGARLQPRQPIAKIGEHTAQVLRDLGYDEAQIVALGGGSKQAPQEAA